MIGLAALTPSARCSASISTGAGSDIELRIADVDANGKALTRMDIQKALRAIERELASGAIFSTFSPL